MTTRRRLTGWPPGTAQGATATATELARARQSGQSVRELRNEEARAEAAAVLEGLLEQDKDPGYGPDRMTVKQRWATHLAVGVLRGHKGQDGEKADD